MISERNFMNIAFKIVYQIHLSTYFFLLETKKKNREKNSDFTNEEKLIFSRSFSFKNVCKFIEYRILFGIIINKLMLNH